jgi:Leucine-rich repeat (LRR) protein
MSRPPRMSVVMERREKAQLAPVTGEEAQRLPEHLRSRAPSLPIAAEDGAVNPGAYAIQVVRRSQRMLQEATPALGSSTSSWDPTSTEAQPGDEEADNNEVVDNSEEGDNDVEADNDRRYGFVEKFPDEQSDAMSTAATRPTLTPALNASVRFADKKPTPMCKRWHKVIAVFSILATGVGIAAYVVSKHATNKGDNDITPNEDTTQDVDSCDFTDVPDPSPALQCSCFSSISKFSPETQALYSQIKTTQLLTDYSGPDDTCRPENMALWWSVMDFAAANDNIFDAPQNNISKQRFGLALLYLALTGWTHSEWLGLGSECDWEGVDCDDSLEVSGLRLDGKGTLGLKGDLPAATFEHLTGLTEIVLSNNALEGKIPLEIWTRAENLQVLDLSFNSLEGSIPDAVQYLAKLDTLILHNNLLVGTIPEALYSLTALVKLSFYSNSISGTISEDVGKLFNLEYLSLGKNALSGSLPTSLGSLTKLQKFHAGDGNSLDGSLPTELGLLSTSLQELNLGLNEMTGTLPTILGALIELTNLELLNNGFSGTLPQELDQLTNMVTLDLSSNRFTGTLPSLHVESTLNLSGNGFTGTAPETLCSVASVTLPCEVQCDCCPRQDGNLCQ